MPSSFRFKTLLAEETIIFWASTGQLCMHQNQFPNKSAIVGAREGGGGALGISVWGCAAGTLEPLTYTRASSAEFCYPILE